MLLGLLLLLVSSVVPLKPICYPNSGINLDRTVDVIQQFDEYNTVFFKSKLPAKTMVLVCDGPLRLGNVMGEITQDIDEDGTKSYVIELDAGVNVAQVTLYLTLLHEMIHEYLYVTDKNYYGQHDDKFRNVVRRLLKMGAYKDLVWNKPRVLDCIVLGV